MTTTANKALQPYLEEAQTKYKTLQWFKTRSDYYDAYLHNRIDDKMIMYEAFYGRGITCNPGELFRYLLKDERFADYTHVWSLEASEDNEKVKAEYAAYDNVIFCETFSEEYFKYLSTAKYLINNVTWQSYVIKKEGQVMVNTWHGIPLKSVGYDIPGGDIEMRNMLRNFLMTDYIVSPVPYTTENFRKAFKLEGLFPGKVIEAGYPRTDATVNFDKAALKEELAKFGVPYDDNKKLILYAPTWKGEKYGKPDYTINEYDSFMKLLCSKVDTEEYQILFKPHQLVYQAMVKSNTVKPEYVPAGINTNLLLGGTDILISDYSSIFFDFLVTGRPILFYIPDLQEYRQQRGLYLSVDELPGPKTASAEELASWLAHPETLHTLTSEATYADAVKKYVCNDDGSVCEKVVNAVFFGDNSRCLSLENGKKKLLLHTDAILVNGISFSAFNLLNNIDTEKYDVTFFSTGEKEYAASYISGLPKSIRVFFKPDAQCANVEMSARVNYCKDNGIAEPDGNPLFPDSFYRSEYRRCFGDAQFDCIADFSGFNSYYANLYYTNTHCKKVIWMHNVMKSEYDKIVGGKQIFKDHLDCVYKLYPYYDGYVSCSYTTMLENRAELATPETYDRFGYAKNLIDASRVYQGVKDKIITELDGKRYLYLNDDNAGELLIPAPEKENINFVTMGRLAEAKNHINLMKAFARFNKEHPASRLYIIGDGPLARKTATTLTNLGLEDKVYLTGSVNNPFAIMSECDCFLLPSHFEGQPMVILEARILGLPIIVSDFATVKDSMYENGQLLIGTSADDIYEALVKFKNGEVPNAYRFDPQQYNREAMEEFEACIN